MHRTKAQCEHGLPWFSDCLECGLVYQGGLLDFQKPTKSDAIFGSEVMLLNYVRSNREAFFRSHPDAARRLTE